jgi:hypothetical protein
VQPYLEHLSGRQTDVVGREGAGHLGLHDVHPHLQHALYSVGNSGKRSAACAGRVVKHKIEAVGSFVAASTPHGDKTILVISRRPTIMRTGTGRVLRSSHCASVIPTWGMLLEGT